MAVQRRGMRKVSKSEYRSTLTYAIAIEMPVGNKHLSLSPSDTRIDKLGTDDMGEIVFLKEFLSVHSNSPGTLLRQPHQIGVVQGMEIIIPYNLLSRLCLVGLED